MIILQFAISLKGIKVYNKKVRSIGEQTKPRTSFYVHSSIRHILDAPLIDNEAVDSLLRRKEKGVLSKLDIEKAYDQINWKFLLTVLQKMGFERKWIGWLDTLVHLHSFVFCVD